MPGACIFGTAFRTQAPPPAGALRYPSRMTESEFVEIARTNPNNAAILKRLPALDLPDVWLVSGCLFQTVWNVMDGHAPTRGIRDYDLFYFDADTSWDAEDAAIKRADDVFADLGIEIELRNQARVHLWYEEKFGAAYPRLARATDGIDRFLSHNCMVGLHPGSAGIAIYAPHGFADIANKIVRPNAVPNFQAVRYREKAERWKSLWPTLTVLPAGAV